MKKRLLVPALATTMIVVAGSWAFGTERLPPVDAEHLTVPEPAALALLGLGLVAIARRLLRRA